VAVQESTFAGLSLVELKNHEEQLQEDPAAQLSKVWQGSGSGTPSWANSNCGMA
jgi:hypothetical protein